MFEICYLDDKEILNTLPHEVQKTILEILQILDTEYGADRDKYLDNGGYIVLVQSKENFEKLKDRAYIDCDTVIPEYVNKILCSDGNTFTNSLVICNSDYTISLIIPMELTPQNLKSYIID